MIRHYVLTILAFAGNIFLINECVAQSKRIEKGFTDTADSFFVNSSVVEFVGKGKGQLKSELTSIKRQVTKNEAFSKIKLLANKPRLKLNIVDVAVGYSYILDTSIVGKGMYSGLSSTYYYGLNSSVTFSGIPFKGNISGNNGTYSHSGTKLNDIYQFNFDPESYREALKSEVLGKISPNDVLGSVMKKINGIKDNYEKSLRLEVEEIKDDYESKYGEKLNVTDDVTDLSVNDATSLRSKLLGEVSDNKLKDESERYHNLLSQDSHSRKQGGADSSLLIEAGKLEALEKILVRTTTWKNRFDNNPTVKKLRENLPFTPDNYKAFLNDPAVLSDVIKKHGSLSSIQSLFLNLTKLDLGQNPVENGQFSVDKLMNTGINTAFQNKRIGAGLITGTNNNPNNWMQGGLNSFINNEYSSMAGLSLGTGSNSLVNSSVSINLFNFSNPSWAEDPTQFLQSAYLPTARRRDAVISLHSDFHPGANHTIGLDFSKSFGSMQNLSAENTSEFNKSAVGGVLSGEGKSNYALAVDYRGDVLSTDVQFLFKNAGLGYNNPGNMFMRRGETQVQFGLGRKLFNRRLTLKYKTDYRNQHFDPDRKFTYISFSNKVNTGWRFKKNTRIGLSYQQTSYTSSNSSYSSTKGNSSILQADGTYSIRLFHKKITNTDILSYQRMLLPSLMSKTYNSNSVFIAHTSTIPLKYNFVMLSMMMNHSNNSDYYFNTSSIHSEANYSFIVAKKVQMVSGVGYYSNKGWNEQVGVKQQVSFSPTKNLLFDLGVDCKRAVRVIRPELANPVFVNTTISYKL